MPTLNLDILVLPTYNKMLLGVADASTYATTPVNPTIEINVPSFGNVVLPFTINTYNLFNSETLGITASGAALVPLPDGIYTLKYSIAPSATNYVEKTILRVDQLQEKFDEAFMKLDMMECDKAIKTQSKVDLNTIYFFIQGAIAAANNCALETATTLYNQAQKMLNNFVKNNCNCSGNNYVINFY
jgi:hypothetical protein